MIVKVVLLLTALSLVTSIPSPNSTVRFSMSSKASAHPLDRGPAERFAHDILRNEFNQAKTNLEEYVQFPELREHSRIRRVQLVPSTEKDVKILLAHFYDEVLKSNRLAFIWQLTVKGERITNIRVLFDGANPFVDENRLVMEYQNKYQLHHILAPAEFPFAITRFSGFIDSDRSLVRVYTNDEIKGFLRIITSPNVVALEQYKGNKDEYYLLKDGTQALYRPNYELGYELLFQKNGMQYTLLIGNKKLLQAKFTAKDLLNTANSMAGCPTGYINR